MPQAARAAALPDLDPRQAVAMHARGEAVLVDVREPHEWALGHAPEAHHVPLARLHPGAVPPGRVVIAVCRSGNRSGRAAAALREAGVPVHNLAGGMQAWAASGHPVVTDDGAPGRGRVSALLAVAMGLLIGLSLGALGGGGSILTVPALVYVIGQDPRAATTSSLFIVGISALIGALGHHRSGRVRWRVGLAFGITGIAASFAGTAANRLVDPHVLLLAFAGLILLAAAGMFAKSQSAARASRARVLVPVGERSTAAPGPAVAEPAAETEAPDGRTPGRTGKVLAAGLLVGFLTGFFGVGGGFVIVPALTLALGLSMPEAVATSLIVIAINSGAALVARSGAASFDWSVIVPFTLAAVAGSLAGKKVADRLAAATLTRSFAVLLVAVAGYTAATSLAGLLG